MSTFISEPGTRLGGRYRLEDRVSDASGWAAWKAIDEILARPVGVLTFAPGFPRIREVLTAARAASRLTDARLAQVFDVEDDWDSAYVVMEWVAGDSLDDLENGAVAAADEEGVKAGGYGFARLLAGGVGGEGLLQMDVGAVAAEEFGDLLDLGAALLVVDEERVEEHHDAAHQAGLGVVPGVG